MNLNLRPANECKFDAVSLGEVMLRLDPGEGLAVTDLTLQKEDLVSVVQQDALTVQTLQSQKQHQKILISIISSVNLEYAGYTQAVSTQLYQNNLVKQYWQLLKQLRNTEQSYLTT